MKRKERTGQGNSPMKELAVKLGEIECEANIIKLSLVGLCLS